MVSRRKILSQSRDNLNIESTFHPNPEVEEDVWYQNDQLCKDHIQEVLNKWTQIDDEIWAKVIVLEKNRRVAKAYARAPVLTVNGSDDGFDGFKIGLCGFDNPMRDPKTEEYKRHIGHGVKIKMDDAGNILIKRVSRCNVFVKNTSQEDDCAIGNEILKLPRYALEPEKPFKLFDMKKFQSNVNRELRSAYPDRRRLECQCLSAIAFVKSEQELLDCPIWVLIINVVAMDMLKSKLPPVQRAVDIKNRPRIPVPDEDPYSVAGSGSGSRDGLLQLAPRRGEKPPKLPPREMVYPHNIPKPDYDYVKSERRLNPFLFFRGIKGKSRNNKKEEDPYYSGLRARVPNFVSKSKVKEPLPSKRLSVSRQQPPILPLPVMHQRHLQQQSMWRTRSFENGIDSDMVESPYNQIYGRTPIPTKAYIPSQLPTMYIGEWD